MLPLSDTSWDLQIQEESRERQVNLGFFYMRSSPTTSQFWARVAEELLTRQEVTWDQDIVNELLDSTKLRTPAAGVNVPLSDFVSPSGLKVHVLDALNFWGLHLGFLYPGGHTTLLQ